MSKGVPHVRQRLRSFSCLFAAVLLLPAPSFAMDAPLSEEAVRDAYFLGQRHGQDFTDLLAKYIKMLSMPESGPYISSITFFTPFALVAQLSSQRAMNYSAQQAEQDHRKQEEFVRIIIQIQLTPSYGALIPRPTGSRSGSPIGYALRPSDFWKDFQVEVLDKDKSLFRNTKLCLRSGRWLHPCRCHPSVRLPRQNLQVRLSHHPNHPSRRKPRLRRLRPRHAPLTVSSGRQPRICHQHSFNIETLRHELWGFRHGSKSNVLALGEHKARQTRRSH